MFEKNVTAFRMFKKALNILKYLAFLSIGVFVFWWVYKDVPVSSYKEAFSNLNYWWIFASIFLNILSQISRAMRWNMLIRPMGYNPKLYNSYFAVVLLYFVNLILPRAGEVFRCTVLTRYEKIPFAKLAGTVFVERMADFITLMVLAVVIILSQFGVFVSFFNTHEDVRQNLMHLFSARNLVLGISIVMVLIFLFILFNRYFMRHNEGKAGSFTKKFRLIKQNFITGIRSVAMLENKWLFVGHTAFIFLMWLFMLYVIFLAFGPTSHLSIQTGMITFMMGGLAMLAPVQGGIGPWHFMVYETLFIYGIPKADGKIFALIAHASTNLIYLILGLLAFAILPLINARRQK
jgi:uncharacterized protein (TIRG00374 family)